MENDKPKVATPEDIAAYTEKMRALPEENRERMRWEAILNGGWNPKLPIRGQFSKP